MHQLVTGPEILELDKSVGIPPIIMMENAGLSVSNYILNRLVLKNQYLSVAVVCGGGNNGADGLVVARKLHSLGHHVEVFFVSPRVCGDVDSVLSSFKSEEGLLNAQLALVTHEIPFHTTLGHLGKFSVIIDAILGAGTRPTSDFAQETRLQCVFDAINDLCKEALVVSVDVPSGICPTSGICLYARPIRPSATITFGRVKSGLAFYQYVGELVLATISYPRHVEFKSDRGIMSFCDIPILSSRDPLGHKGSFGKVFVLAGSGRYYGAPMFSSMSFLKAGGGYARLFCPNAVGAVVAGSAPEVVQLGNEWTEVVEEFLITDSDVVVAGPGIGLDQAACDDLNSCIKVMIRSRVKAVVFDGDALTILAKGKSMLQSVVAQLTNAGIDTILTPHPGELRRLFSVSETSEYGRICATQKVIASSYKDQKLTVVVKGATSATVSSHSIVLKVSGNSGMATCGSGDSLTGVIAAMVCNSLLSNDIQEAITAGVFIHGLAGDLAATSVGEDGMVATDILNHIPAAMQELRTSRDSLIKKYLPRIV
ncbi:ATP-dependent (S)-NAD(P)H-hydrate dehydratase [Perkinsus sp. BL_2016]|nr:ATP-dependent (S)-NAD(P)H-hydrate dehydratase [Perkinsus sp. BL_2016]